MDGGLSIDALGSGLTTDSAIPQVRVGATRQTLHSSPWRQRLPGFPLPEGAAGLENCREKWAKLNRLPRPSGYILVLKFRWGC